MIIYKATNLINNKKYIGQTIQGLKRRKAQHKNSYKYSSTKDGLLGRAIKKYGFENFKWEVIDYADTIEELNDKEIYWIEKERTLVDYGSGYNLNKGGKNGKHSEYTKQRIGESQKGEKNHMYGMTGANNPNSKMVKNIITGSIYESITDCANAEGCEVSKVSAVCRGDRFTTNGYIYRYVDKKTGKVENVIPKTMPKTQPIINLDTMKIYHSIADATKDYGKTRHYLSKKLKESNGCCKWLGYTWKYYNLW